MANNVHPCFYQEKTRWVAGPGTKSRWLSYAKMYLGFAQPLKRASVRERLRHNVVTVTAGKGSAADFLFHLALSGKGQNILHFT